MKNFMNLRAKLIKNEISNSLNKQLGEVKIRTEKENAFVKKKHKEEVKSWKKQLGEERKKNVKLEENLNKKVNKDQEKKLEHKHSLQPLTSPSSQPETLCSICAIPIHNFKPKYFLGETFNPACDNCDDSFEGDNSGPDPNGCKHDVQCVLRQPYPPPPSPPIPLPEDIAGCQVGNSSDIKPIELEEKEEGFIGPSLPRVMSDEECKAFFEKLLGERFK